MKMNVRMVYVEKTAFIKKNTTIIQLLSLLKKQTSK